MKLRCIRETEGLTVGKFYEIHSIKGAGTIYGHSFIVKNDNGYYVEYQLFDFIKPGEEHLIELREVTK